MNAPQVMLSHLMLHDDGPAALRSIVPLFVRFPVKMLADDLDRLACKRDPPLMTPIERAARALCKLEGHPENIKFEGKLMWESDLLQSITVADALQEPSRMMVEGGAEILRVKSVGRTETVAEDDAANVWRLMIGVLREEAQ